jgi:hypothetical protein
MGEMRGAHQVLVRKSERKGQVGRLYHRWMTLNGYWINRMRSVAYISLAQDEAP